VSDRPAATSPDALAGDLDGKRAGVSRARLHRRRPQLVAGSERRRCSCLELALGWSRLLRRGTGSRNWVDAILSRAQR
jgi:hypothetical protein